MISNLKVNGYKCLQMATPLPIASLNVLVGANASGKSTLMQALLLLRQSVSQQGEISYLHLSGDLYEAGTTSDVLHPGAQHRIQIELSDDGNGVQTFVFNSDRGESQSRRLQSEPPAMLNNCALASREGAFSYLNAERVGPRISYALPPDELGLAGAVGKYGEFTTGKLARSLSEQTPIDEWSSAAAEIFASAPRLLDGLDISEKLSQSGGRIDWVSNEILGWIIPGATFLAEEDSRFDSAPLRFIRDPSATKVPTRATHVGFGLAYSLPIIVAGLSLRKGGLLLVENPEAHLHPFGQSRIGAFLATLAASGRQIFVETHSDHVVNGIRLAVKNGLIDPSAVLFDYFQMDSDCATSKITQIHADDDGSLEDWPAGFFDQIEQDLSRL